MGIPSMADSFLSYLPQLIHGVTFFGIMGCVAKAFDWADGGLSQESRTKLSLWLTSVPGSAQINAWASVFPNLISRLFGNRAFSLQFLLRSCIASVAAVAITEILMIALLGRNALTSSNGSFAYETLAYYLLIALPINCIPDYFSLLFSRFVVLQMAKRPTITRVAALLVLDSAASLVIATAAIALLAPFMSLFGRLGAVDVEAHGFRETISMLIFVVSTYMRTLVQPGGWGPFLRLYVFASLFTSIWVWLYIAGSVVVRTLHSARKLWAKIVPFLSIEDKPMQAIGRVAGVLAAFAYLAAVGAIWLLQHVQSFRAKLAA